MLERFCDHCKKEWAVLRQAPITFCITLLLAIAIAFAAVSWLYGRELDTQKATIEFQTQKLEDYRDKLQGASPDEAAKKIAELTRQVELLKPPQLTESEMERVLAILRMPTGNKPFVTIVRNTASQNPLYEKQWYEILRMAGWTVEQDMGIANTAGVHIRVSDSNASGAKMLQDAFGAVNVLAQGEVDESVPAGQIVLIIGDMRQ